MSRILTVSLGRKANEPEVTKVWRGTFQALVDQLTSKVRDTTDKGAAGWVCGAAFNPEYRHSDNFTERSLLSLDYDHLDPSQLEGVLVACRETAFLAYTTWSHTAERPRIRIWIPLSRGLARDEFEAVSRRFASRAGIELAARESHVPAQFMWRPCSQAGIPFEVWKDTDAPYLDVDKVLAEYADWKDRSTWPHRADGDSCHAKETVCSPLDKPGIVGDFCRAFSISAAIARFDLPYKPGSGQDRWTYTAGSRADGAVIYDEDTKLHSHHDTDPARGQHNAYDLVRLHKYGALDSYEGDTSLSELPSSKAMHSFAMGLPELAAARHAEAEFTDLDSVGVDTPDLPRTVDVGLLPASIPSGSSDCSDLENARRIQRAHGHEIISVGKAFYTWQKTHWVKDEATVGRIVAGLSALVIREASGRDEDHVTRLRKWAAVCCSAKTMNACEALLRRQLNFEGANLNAERNLFSCRSGTLDLASGHVRPHSPADFITASAPTGYDPSAKAPRFHQFLREIFRGDDEAIAFVRRWLGYCLTGEVREHAMVFHIGPGGNGKSTLMDAVRHVVGPGYASVGADGLLAASTAGPSPHIAKLLGQRMVTLTETNQDEEFNESALKRLTSGDRLMARNLFEGLFEFNPTHKIQIFTNNEPRIIGQDRGIWRRLLLLKYPVRYGRPDEVAAGQAQYVKDDHLDAKLAAEAEGILAWLVEGAKEWYRVGLNPPLSVQKATEEFRASQDNVGLFLSERTVVDPEGCVALSGAAESLYGAYKGWVNEMGCRPLGRTRFAKEVARAAPWATYGVHRDKKAPMRGFKGIRLSSEVLL